MCRFLSFVQDADGNIYHLHPDIVVDVENLPVQVFGKTSTGNENADSHSDICKAYNLAGSGIAYEVVFGASVGLRVDGQGISDPGTSARLIGIAHLWLIEQRKIETKRFSSADLRGANLEGANLEGANLRYADLTGAKWNEYTTWPKGFELPTKGT